MEDVIEMIESECTFMHNVSGTDEIEDGQRPDRKPNKGDILGVDITHLVPGNVPLLSLSGRSGSLGGKGGRACKSAWLCLDNPQTSMRTTDHWMSHRRDHTTDDVQTLRTHTKTRPDSGSSFRTIFVSFLLWLPSPSR